MSIPDLIRALVFLPAGLTYGFAIANLIVSYRVLLKPHEFTWRTFISGGGFVWLHIVAVVVPFQGFVTWGCIEVALRFEEGMTWRGSLLAALCTTINIGYIIIYRVELSRLRMQRPVGGGCPRTGQDPAARGNARSGSS